MPYRLVVKNGFAAAHRIVGSGGRCENMHGHNFKVELTVGGDRLDGAGMLMDFGDLKAILGEVVGDLDHRDLNDHPAFEGRSPSSENLAEHIYREAERRHSGSGVGVISVTVSESDTASATYMPAGV